MSAPSKFASTFAPYTPPPDEPSYPSSTTSASRLWFPSQNTTSYQAGAVPSFSTSQAGGLGSIEEAEAEAGTSAWETTYGARVDVLAAFAYLLGPFSALGLLILETHNDYVRFHAYQSALLSTPLVLLRIWVSLMQFAPWFRTACTVLVVVFLAFMAWRAFIDASRNGLSRYQIPGLGSLAERWVSEE